MWSSLFKPCQVTWASKLLSNAPVSLWLTTVSTSVDLEDWNSSLNITRKISFHKMVNNMPVNGRLKQFTNDPQDTNWSILWWSEMLTRSVKDWAKQMIISVILESTSHCDNNWTLLGNKSGERFFQTTTRILSRLLIFSVVLFNS